MYNRDNEQEVQQRDDLDTQRRFTKLSDFTSRQERTQQNTSLALINQ